MQHLMETWLKNFGSLIRFKHTLFGLPFILIGTCLPFFDKNLKVNLTTDTCKIGLFIFLSFIAARISGMAFNQYLDRHIDSLNPRTCDRPVAKGVINSKYALTIACTSLVLFLIFTLCIHKLCFLVSCFTASLLVLYSFMKRIHYSCHLVLGLIHFLGPFSAFIAIKQVIDWPIILISAAAFFLNAANDILYSLQDFDFDCQQKLHSIPSRFGITKSCKIAASFQACCIFCLILFAIALKLAWVFYCAPCIAAIYFYRFHKKWNRDPTFFFSAQIAVSISTLIFTLVALIIN